jgi:hypothetical protein
VGDRRQVAVRQCGNGATLSMAHGRRDGASSFDDDRDREEGGGGVNEVQAVARGDGGATVASGGGLASTMMVALRVDVRFCGCWGRHR